MRRVLVICAVAVVALAAGRSSVVGVLQRGLESGRQAGWDLLVGDLPPARLNLCYSVVLDGLKLAESRAKPPVPKAPPGGSCGINWKQSSQAGRGSFTLTLNSMGISDVALCNEHGSQYVIYSVWNPFVQLTDRHFRVKAPPETEPPTLVKLDYAFTYEMPHAEGAGPFDPSDYEMELRKRENIELKRDGPHTHVTVSAVSGAEVGLWDEGQWTPLDTAVIVDKAWSPGCPAMWGFTWSIEPRCWGNYGKYALWLDDLMSCGKTVDASTLYRRMWNAEPAPGFWVEGTSTGTVGVWGPSASLESQKDQPCQPPSS
ncbi:MAG: hypothetical protein ACYC63_09140 [Armatimonadota bacterium]